MRKRENERVAVCRRALFEEHGKRVTSTLEAPFVETEVAYLGDFNTATLRALLVKHMQPTRYINVPSNMRAVLTSDTRAIVSNKKLIKADMVALLRVSSPPGIFDTFLQMIFSSTFVCFSPSASSFTVTPQ